MKMELRYCRACETEVDAVDGECTKCGQPTTRMSEMSVRLFDAHGEVRVGDVARYGRKPVIVERFGVDPHLNTVVVHVVTMDERKHFIKLLPYQLGMVVGSESESEVEDVEGGNEWTGAKEGNHGTV